MPAPPRRTLAIIACVKSGRKERFLNQTALSRTLLPSLAETVTEAERALWTLRLYLCADADDAMYMREAQAVVDAPPRWLEKRLRFYRVMYMRDQAVVDDPPSGRFYRRNRPSREAAAKAPTSCTARTTTSGTPHPGGSPQRPERSAQCGRRLSASSVRA